MNIVRFLNPEDAEWGCFFFELLEDEKVISGLTLSRVRTNHSTARVHHELRLAPQATDTECTSKVLRTK